MTASADCECGYSINATNSPQHAIFTDLIESDFTKIQNISLDTDWKVQRHFSGYDPASGHFGRKYAAENVISNPLLDNSSISGGSELGGDAGLQFWVRSKVGDDNHVSCGEIGTVRNDTLYGSYRVSMKLTPLAGTDSTFFSVSPKPHYQLRSFC